MSDPVAFDDIRHYDGRADLQTIVWVQRERRLGDKTERETSYSLKQKRYSAALDDTFLLQMLDRVCSDCSDPTVHFFGFVAPLW